MVASGLRNKVIAERLGIGEGTVKIRLHHVYEKLGVESPWRWAVFDGTGASPEAARPPPF